MNTPQSPSGDAASERQGTRSEGFAPARSPVSAESQRSYWRSNLRLIGVLLSVWVAVSFGLSLLLAPWLNTWRIGRLPLGFWWAQQGSIIVFVLLVFIYAWQLDRLDRKHGVRE